MIGMIVGGLLAIIAIVGIANIAKIIIKITFNWVRNKINSILAKPKAKKVYVQDIDEMVKKDAESCKHTMSREEFNNYTSKMNESEINDYDLVVASIDDEGQVQDIELVKNTDAKLDEEVERLLGSKREILVTN